MNPITVSSIQDEKELFLLKEFMLKQPQYYPNYKGWVDGKCKSRIETGRYKTIFAMSDNKIIGDCIYHYLSENEIEIKNFRIDPKYQNRDLGHFIFSQIKNKNLNITLDVTVDNFAGVQFFIKNGFRIQDKKNLYLPDQSEYIMKRINQFQRT